MFTRAAVHAPTSSVGRGLGWPTIQEVQFSIIHNRGCFWRV